MTIELNKNIELVEDKYLDYTRQILSSLKQIRNNHNSSSSQKIRMSQLIEVFLSGANDENPHKSLQEKCLARVFMFLDILRGTLSFNNIHKKTLYHINKQMVDLTSSWTPSEEHYSAAEECIKQSSLTFNLSSIDSLYLSYSRDASFYQQYL